METRTKLLQPDAKGRITIGRSEGVAGYELTREADGRIILVPMAAIPVSEMWVFENKAEWAKIERGMRQSRKGEQARWGSFAAHARGGG